jgi:hypothetical protein
MSNNYQTIENKLHIWGEVVFEKVFQMVWHLSVHKWKKLTFIFMIRTIDCRKLQNPNKASLTESIDGWHALVDI